MQELGPRVQSNSSSSGSQYSNNNSGTQNNNSGPGSQYNAQNITILRKEESDAALLADLRVTDPRDDKVRIERTKGGLLRDSYCWILDHNDFAHWRSEAQGQLLWIKGDPGKGKTMLLCGIIDDLEKLGHELVYFFCQATDARLNTATAVLRGLLYMLFNLRRPLIGAAREKYEQAGKQLFEDMNSWDVLCKLITDIICDDKFQNVILVVDALDECITGLDQLLDFIVHLPLSQTKVVVSSRNWPVISDAMSAATHKIPICLELNEQAISGAVNNYIQYKVDQLARLKKYDDATRDEVHTYLTLKANNTFLWVSLVSQQLADHRVSKRHTKMKLNEFPPGLDALYERMLAQVSESIDADLCKEILAFLLVVYRPVELQELASLMKSLEVFLDDIQSLEEIIGECGSLLTVRGGVVYFVHQSAKDFLLQNALEKVMPLGIGHEHKLLLSRSIQVMSKTLRRNMYHLDAPGLSVSESCIPIPDPLAPARYACVYWVEHLRNTALTEDQQRTQVYTFLALHYLHWLEALSLLRSMSEGIAGMSKLARAVQMYAESSPLDRLVQDALRFIWYHRIGIEKAPLQAYSSALIFSPTRSIVRNQFFEDQLAKWITTEPIINDDWSPCLQTLEGHEDEVRFLVFSKDGATLASASFDTTVKLWDTTTSQCLQTLVGHDAAVGSVTFSHNGDRLASASEDGIVKLWNSTTGRCLQTLQGRHGRVFSVAFHSSDTQLTLATDDGTLVLWSTTTGQYWQPLRRLSLELSVTSMAFSADGGQIALATRSKTINIFDTSTGELFKSFEIPPRSKNPRKFIGKRSGYISSVAFSGDGCQLVTCSPGDIRVWKIMTGECMCLLAIENFSCEVVTFSADGSRIASADGNSLPIRIWDAMTSDKLQELTGHSAPALALAFSGDNTQFASASIDRSVKLWEVASHRGQCKSGDGSVEIPHGSQRSASSNQHKNNSLDETSLKAHQYIRPFDVHSSSVTSVAFSADGQQLASISNHEIKLWDTKTCRCLETLKVEGYGNGSVTFLKGKVHFARALYKSIEICDPLIGTCIQKLEGHSDDVIILAFSADGATLASSSIDETVRLWDTSTGHCKMVFNTKTTLSHIKFSTTGLQLDTDVGVIQLDVQKAVFPSPTMLLAPRFEPLEQQGYWVKVDRTRRGEWIRKDSKKLLWLPPEYRTGRFDIRGSAIALACTSGQILLIRFSELDSDFQCS